MSHFDRLAELQQRIRFARSLGLHDQVNDLVRERDELLDQYNEDHAQSRQSRRSPSQDHPAGHTQ